MALTLRGVSAAQEPRSNPTTRGDTPGPAARTPAAAYAARPKAHPAGRGAPGLFRLRYDVADGKGAITLRRGGRMHHLKVGTAHARQRVLAIVDEQEVTVVALDTGELLSVHRIEPGKGYWRTQRRDPGRWPGSHKTG